MQKEVNGETDNLQQILDYCSRNNISYEQIEQAMKPAMYAIIPVSILERQDLSANAKLLYAEIIALSKSNGKCYATNKYIANRLGLSSTSINRPLRELEAMGLVSVETTKSQRGTYRNIYPQRYIAGGGDAGQHHGVRLDSVTKRELNKVELNKSKVTKVTLGEPPEKVTFGDKIIKTFEELNKVEQPEKLTSNAELSKPDKRNPDINAAFEYWNEVMGYPVTSRIQANRYACKNILKKTKGIENMRKLIDGVALTVGDKYAPRISDFTDLQRKLNELLLWGKKRNSGIIKV
jgi:DNA-binding Lrp family transcriptional regulator